MSETLLFTFSVVPLFIFLISFNSSIFFIYLVYQLLNIPANVFFFVPVIKDMRGLNSAGFDLFKPEIILDCFLYRVNSYSISIITSAFTLFLYALWKIFRLFLSSRISCFFITSLVLPSFPRKMIRSLRGPIPVLSHSSVMK